MKFPVATIAFLAGAALAFPSIANARDDAAHFSVGLTAGTLGVGPELGYRASPLFGVRGSATFLGANRDVDVNDITYNGDLKLSSYGMSADLYPFNGGLRVSGGFRIDRNRIDIMATPASAVSVGNTVYTPAEIGTLSGTVKASEFAPLLTVGYAAGLTRGIKLGLDAGAMFHGRPTITDLTATGLFASNPSFQSEVANEQKKIDDRIRKYEVYPVVQLSLNYAF